MKRLDCAGVLILNEDQAHWVEGIEIFPKSAILVRRSGEPVTMRHIVDKLHEFVPSGSHEPAPPTGREEKPTSA